MLSLLLFFACGDKRLLDLFQLVAQTTIQTSRICAITMQFDDLCGVNARLLVQIVNILRNHMRNFALRHKLRDGFVALIGLGSANFGINSNFAPPRLNSHFFTGNKILKHNRLHARPHAARTAEIWNAAFRAHACASKNHDALGFIHPLP